MARRRKTPPPPRERRKAPEISNNLVGEPCTHTYERYRGYRMCSQPLCAQLSTMDGYLLTKKQWVALIQQLRSEGLDL